MARHDDIARIRAFNRLFFKSVGLLDRAHERSQLSVVEARMLYEVREQPGCNAVALQGVLQLDGGHISRLIKGLCDRALLRRTRDHEDRRSFRLELTNEGATVLAGVEKNADKRVASFLEQFDRRERADLMHAIKQICEIIGGSRKEASSPPSFVIRHADAGDIGTVLQRQALYYATRSDWDIVALEADIARGLAELLESGRHGRSRLWIAEAADNRFAGSVAIVEREERLAQFRFLLVEGSFQGLGLGKRLSELALNFAERQSFERLYLDTAAIDVNAKARQLYKQLGFELVREAQEDFYGRVAPSERWEIKLPREE